MTQAHEQDITTHGPSQPMASGSRVLNRSHAREEGWYPSGHAGTITPAMRRGTLGGLDRIRTARSRSTAHILTISLRGGRMKRRYSTAPRRAARTGPAILHRRLVAYTTGRAPLPALVPSYAL
jgi:hypothetical protein